jgi:pimeloyl-ACP methyl ester carboxylesterase
VDACGARIEVHVEGAGPLLLLLPSLGRGAEDFDVLAPKLAWAGYRIARPEPRGIGASRGPMQNLTLHDYARDIAAVIESLGGPAVIAGHAAGNWVARTTAADRPDLVRAVIILASAHKGRVAPSIRESITRSADASLPIDERLGHLRHAFFAPGNDPSVWLGGWNREAMLALRAAHDATPVEDWWAAGGTAPILDVQAREDVMAPHEGTNRLCDELGSRVKIAVIADAGHALIPEQPDRVAAALIDFLQGLGPA